MCVYTSLLDVYRFSDLTHTSKPHIYARLSKYLRAYAGSRVLRNDGLDTAGTMAT